MKTYFAQTIALGFFLLFLTPPAFAAGKILFVDSYHQENKWSIRVEKSIRSVLAGKDVELEVIHMDTKRNKSEDFKKSAALKVKERIDRGDIDVVIASDDNASKYLIMPYYKNSDIPFVFCGVNWDASVYGYPYKNATGMVEVSPLPLLMKHLKPYVKGERMAVITADTTTGHKNVRQVKKIFRLDFAKEVFANRFEDWKKAFLDIQEHADMLLLLSATGISGWNAKETEQFVLSNVRIPVGIETPSNRNFGLMGFVKIPEEHGEYAAGVALKILNGASPSDFPVINSRRGDLILNMKMANKIGVRFPLSLIKIAKPENIIR